MNKSQTSRWRLTAIFFIALNYFSAGHAFAGFEFEGVKTVSVVTADGKMHELGHVTFSPESDGDSRFVLDLDIHKFTDYFLSMKEFKCIPADAEVTCHVPYPYQSPLKAGATELVWLEHRLLFLFKKPKEFGANLWNGIYFELHEEGDALVGTPQAIDLNEISAPPEDLTAAPYTSLNRHDMPIKERWVQQLRIEAIERPAD